MVILGGIKNEKLLGRVNEVFKRNISKVAPFYFNELLALIPSEQYFRQYINENEGGLSD